MIMLALGTPLSWAKTAVGHTNVWLGFEINCYLGTVRVGDEKLPAVLEILRLIASGSQSTEKQIEQWAGILNWAAMLCMGPVNSSVQLYQAR